MLFTMSDEDWSRMLSLPHVVAAEEAIAKKSHRIPTFKDHDEYLIGESRGLYGITSDTDEHDAWSWMARRLAVTVSSSVVGVSCYGSGYRPLCSSGIVVDFANGKKVLTTAYIVGGRSQNEAISLSLDIHLPNRATVKGHVVYVDQHLNIAVIHGDLDGVETATFDTRLADLNESVVAVGRQINHKLMASRGLINIRDDHLDSDELMSSSCHLYEWGIGGPLIDSSSGKVIGMNFFSRKGFTPFIPSIILIQCMKHFLHHGKIVCPWLGLRTRNLHETDDLELIYMKFKDTGAIFVKEVMKGSPAERAGLCVGDIIVQCNGTPICSPVQFAQVLLMVKPPRRVTSFKLSHAFMMGFRASRIRKRVVKVAILKEFVAEAPRQTKAKHIVVSRFTPAVINRWPVLPPM